MGYRSGVSPVVPAYPSTSNVQALQSQRNILEDQIKSLQESLKNIEKRLSEIQKKE
jgi:prefoldin subunit 5